MNTHSALPQDANQQEDTNFLSSPKQQWKEMREEKINNDIDPSLQSPQDANTQKHFNFIENEQEDLPGNTSSYEDEQSPAKQQWKEMREEKTDNYTDPSLQSPQDANTEKHINFLESEDEETTNRQSEDND